MLLIPCPYCGDRHESEFVCGGQAHVVRPDPQASDDAAWARYLYYRTNTRGSRTERWFHIRGCRRWFNVVRNTASHEIVASYRMGESPPQ